MKGWKIIKPLTIKEEEIQEESLPENCEKIKIIKSLITLEDVLRYNGEIETGEIILGSSAIGLQAEKDAETGEEILKHVYIEPSKSCGECYNCKNGETDKCLEIKTAGEDFNGFLADFATVEKDKIYVLPDSVNDNEALFIKQISLIISIIDKLQIQKGDYVTVVGANNFGNIFSQILKYYQAVPILITNDQEDCKIAKESGIYYVLDKEDNWQKEVFNITGGRMASFVIHVASSNIPVAKAFSLASYNGLVALTGVSYKNNSITFNQAIKKDLQIYCINNDMGNVSSGINLLANKAIDFTHLIINQTEYNEVPKAFEKMNSSLEKDDKVYETIVNVMQ